MVKSSKEELFAKYPTKHGVNHLSTRCAPDTNWSDEDDVIDEHMFAAVVCIARARALLLTNWLNSDGGRNFISDCDATAMHCPRRCWIIYRVVRKYRIINSMKNSDWCSIYWNWYFDVTRRSGRARVRMRTWFVSLHICCSIYRIRVHLKPTAKANSRAGSAVPLREREKKKKINSRKVNWNGKM